MSKTRQDSQFVGEMRKLIKAAKDNKSHEDAVSSRLGIQVMSGVGSHLEALNGAHREIFETTNDKNKQLAGWFNYIAKMNELRDFVINKTEYFFEQKDYAMANLLLAISPTNLAGQEIKYAQDEIKKISPAAFVGAKLCAAIDVAETKNVEMQKALITRISELSVSSKIDDPTKFNNMALYMLKAYASLKKASHTPSPSRLGTELLHLLETTPDIAPFTNSFAAMINKIVDDEKFWSNNDNPKAVKKMRDKFKNKQLSAADALKFCIDEAIRVKDTKNPNAPGLFAPREPITQKFYDALANFDMGKMIEVYNAMPKSVDTQARPG